MTLKHSGGLRYRHQYTTNRSSFIRTMCYSVGIPFPHITMVIEWNLREENLYGNTGERFTLTARLSASLVTHTIIHIRSQIRAPCAHRRLYRRAALQELTRDNYLAILLMTTFALRRLQTRPCPTRQEGCELQYDESLPYVAPLNFPPACRQASLHVCPFFSLLRFCCSPLFPPLFPHRFSLSVPSSPSDYDSSQRAMIDATFAGLCSRTARVDTSESGSSDVRLLLPTMGNLRRQIEAYVERSDGDKQISDEWELVGVRKL